jgi:hypothetical protein
MSSISSWVVLLRHSPSSRLAGAALVEQDHAVLLGIEEAAVLRRQAGARAAVQMAITRCRLPPFDGVQVVDRQHAVTAGRDRGNRVEAGSNMAIL